VPGRSGLDSDLSACIDRTDALNQSGDGTTAPFDRSTRRAPPIRGRARGRSEPGARCSTPRAAPCA